MSCGAQWNCICGECPLPGNDEDATFIIRELRQKLAIAGVEGSPPPGEETTIGALLTRAQNAEEREVKWRNALIRFVSAHTLTGPADDSWTKAVTDIYEFGVAQKVVELAKK